MNRSTKLYNRYNSMNRPQGNGDTECLICNCNFGLLAANPRICNNCLKVIRLIRLVYKLNFYFYINRMCAHHAV